MQQPPIDYSGQPLQMPVSSDELYATQLQEDKIRNIISQISPTNQVEEIEMRIKGYKKNILTGDWEKVTDSKSQIPDVMVGRYISWLSSFMSLNTTLGNLSSQQITRIMKNAVEWVVDDIDAHAEEYNFGQDFTERTRVGDILLLSSFLVLNRSLNGAEARRFWSSLSLAESSSMNPMQQNKSDWWKFWKK